MAKKHHKKKIIFIVVGLFIVVLAGVRIWLPSFIEKEVNRQLEKIDGYEGSVGDVDLFLIAGEYSIDSVRLDKTSGKVPVPFFSAQNISFSVEWKALFQGEIVGEIVVDRPKLNYVSGPSEETSQTEVDSDWTDVVDNLMPLRINRFEINRGEIHFRNFHSDPKIDLLMQHVDIVATNLTNAKDHENPLPSTVEARAKVYDGLASLNLRLDPLNETPTFDLNAELTALNLAHLNNFLRAYGNFDVKKGSFSLYAEAAAKNKKITGYAKPILKDVDVAQWEEKGDLLQKIWERVVGAVSWVFENKSKDQVATEVQFQGTIDNPDIDIWTLVGQILRNAFIEALYPSLENSISIGSVGESTPQTEGGLFEKKKDKDDDKGFFDNLFGNDKKEDR